MVFHKVRMLFGLLHLPLDLPALLTQGCTLDWPHQQVQWNGPCKDGALTPPEQGPPQVPHAEHCSISLLSSP